MSSDIIPNHCFANQIKIAVSFIADLSNNIRFIKYMKKTNSECNFIDRHILLSNLIDELISNQSNKSIIYDTELIYNTPESINLIIKYKSFNEYFNVILDDNDLASIGIMKSYWAKEQYRMNLKESKNEFQKKESTPEI